MTSINPKDELKFLENLHCQPDKPLKKNFFDDSKCFPKIWPEVAIKDIVSAQEYQPETISIPILELQNIIDALECGLEHTQTVLAEHDASLGRTTRKNKNWAEQLEKDIEFLKDRIKFSKLKIIGVTTHYP